MALYEQFHRLLEEYWEKKLEWNPIFASFVGDYRYNDKLPEVTEERIQEELALTKEFLKRLRQIPKKELSKADQVNYEILEKELLDSILETEFKSYYFPLSNVGGFHITLPELSRQLRMETKKDYEDYTLRLWGIRSFVSQYIELMRKGLSEGYLPAKDALEGVVESIQVQLCPAEKSPFLRPFWQFPSVFTEKEREELFSQAKEAYEKSVYPAYEELLCFVKEEYLKKARVEPGICHIPRGREFYQHRVRMYTSTDLSPEEVHEIGKKEVARIRREMEEVIQKVQFSGSFSEFLTFLRTDERFYAKTEKELLMEVSYVLKKMDGELPRLFRRLPRMPYGIRKVPEQAAPKAPTGYYMPPAGDGSRAGFYYVNTYDLKSRPLYEVETLSLHEAVPGHHLQIALQQELDLPPFRRFGGSTAYMEGWALYAERLGREVGFYEDPYSFFGHLTYEIWRACRLVVDTGIHFFGWSREEAERYLLENSALTPVNVRAEVIRYIGWPGQALAYKIGELKIRELRKKVEKTLGREFDLREFHDLLLSQGAVPLHILEKLVDEYLQEKLQKA